jgi:lipoprotein-anchoring transpeptidase ErfK/SrfK
MALAHRELKHSLRACRHPFGVKAARRNVTDHLHRNRRLGVSGFEKGHAAATVARRYAAMSMFEQSISRRRLMLGATSLAAVTLAGCATAPPPPPISTAPLVHPEYLKMYAALPDEEFPVPRAEIEKIDPRYYRKVVPDPTGERPGTVVVDTASRFLYLVREDGQAIRYGVGVGRDGFLWSGRGEIALKKKWPTWTPPAQMIEREPELEPYRNGMPPGIDNPLGARALYIFENGRDTLYRLHGNNDPYAIGKAVSSGCIRLLNQDVIDLYSRVPAGTDVLVA